MLLYVETNVYSIQSYSMPRLHDLKFKVFSHTQDKDRWNIVRHTYLSLHYSFSLEESASDFEWNIYIAIYHENL